MASFESSQDGYATSVAEGSNSQFQDSFLYCDALQQDSGPAILDRQRLYSESSNAQLSNTQMSGEDASVLNASIMSVNTLNNFSHIFRSKASVGDHVAGHKRNNEVVDELPHKKLDISNSADRNRNLQRSSSFTAAMAETLTVDMNAECQGDPGSSSGCAGNSSSSGITVPVGRLQSDFTVVDVVGSGVFGTVYEVVGKIDRNRYAIKVSRESFRGEHDKNRLVNEVYVLAALAAKEVNNGDVPGVPRESTGAVVNNRNIIRYFGTWIEENHVYIQMELCETSVEAVFNQYLQSINEIVPHEETHSWTPSSPSPDDYPFSLLDASNIARDMLHALNFLHNCDYAHLDIKPGNILIKSGVYKLSDFGLAVPVSRQRKSTSGEDQSQSQGELNPGASSTVTVEEGDAKYMARELLDWGYKDLKKCDMFSLGASIYEICSGEPLPGEGEAWQSLRNGSYNREPRQINSTCVMETEGLGTLRGDEFMDLLGRLLQPDPGKRLDPAQCLSMFSCLKSPLEAELAASRKDIVKLKNLVRFNSARPELSIAIPSKCDGNNDNARETAVVDTETVPGGAGFVTPKNAPTDALSNSSSISASASSGRKLKRAHTVQ